MHSHMGVFANSTWKHATPHLFKGWSGEVQVRSEIHNLGKYPHSFGTDSLAKQQATSREGLQRK